MVALIVFAQIAAASPSPGVIRFNQLGYLPDAPKVAMYCALQPTEIQHFTVSDATGKTVRHRRDSEWITARPRTRSLRSDRDSASEVTYGDLD